MAPTHKETRRYRSVLAVRDTLAKFCSSTMSSTFNCRCPIHLGLLYSRKNSFNTVSLSSLSLSLKGLRPIRVTVITLTHAVAAPSCCLSLIGDTLYFPKDLTGPSNRGVCRLKLLVSRSLPFESSAISKLPPLATRRDKHLSHSDRI